MGDGDDILLNLNPVALVGLVHALDLGYFHYRSNWRIRWRRHLALETVNQPLVLLALNH